MLNLEGIKNIIFDLGGVIINIDHNKAISSFQQLLGNDFNELEQNLTANNILEKYETSAISTNEFISIFKKFKPALTNQEIIDAWNSMLLEIPQERILIIRKLARKHRVFLLSNTNEIHLNNINQHVKDEFGFNEMSSLFEKAYYSHEMGLRKPNPNIFEEILIDKNLVPKETLFIDDSEEHIISAKLLNLETHHLLATENIIDIFNGN